MCRHRPALHSNHGGGTAYAGEVTPERRAAVARPGMSAHTASQPDTTNACPPVSLTRGPNPPENQAPGRVLARPGPQTRAPASGYHGRRAPPVAGR
jgi:hypothetical protein